MSPPSFFKILTTGKQDVPADAYDGMWSIVDPLHVPNQEPQLEQPRVPPLCTCPISDLMGRGCCCGGK